VVFNLFYISYPLSNKITRFIAIHSLVLIHRKYEINKVLQFRMIYKNLLWLQFMVQMTHAEEDGEAYFAV